MGTYKKVKPINRSEIHVKEGTIKHYKPEKTDDAFDDQYNEYKNKGDENTSNGQYFEKMGPYLGEMIEKL